jgi:hypothetical protein
MRVLSQEQPVAGDKISPCLEKRIPRTPELATGLRPAPPLRPKPATSSSLRGLYIYVTERPQTTEIMKTFNQRCPKVAVTSNVAKADFNVTLDHEGGKGYLHRRDKIVVFNREETISLPTRPANLGMLSRMHAKRFFFPFRRDEASAAASIARTASLLEPGSQGLLRRHSTRPILLQRSDNPQFLLMRSPRRKREEKLLPGCQADAAPK